MDGTDRTVLVNDDLTLPNGLTYNPMTRELCWADAGQTSICVDDHPLVVLSVKRDRCFRNSEGGVHGPVLSSQEESDRRDSVPVCHGVLRQNPLLHGLEEVRITLQFTGASLSSVMINPELSLLGKRWLPWMVRMGRRWKSFFLRNAPGRTASPSRTHNALKV